MSVPHCLYPNCTHLNDDKGITDLCGCHIQDLIQAIKRKKKENPNYHRGKGAHKIREYLLRTEILELLNVDETTIRDIVSKVKPPYSFEMVSIGKYENAEDRQKLKFRQFKSEYFDMVRHAEKAFCSVFFVYHKKDDSSLELVMFRTRSKHVVGELEKRMATFIIPRLKEIVFAQQEYPFNEWRLHVSYDGHYFHYE